MSTVPEVIAARHMGLRVLGLSCITNQAAGVSKQKLDHEEVLQVGRQVQSSLVQPDRKDRPRDGGQVSSRIQRPSPAEFATLGRAARPGSAEGRVPYSKYKVGAALRATDGTIVTGCNVENASYPLTMCAERVAAGKAVSEGFKRFDAIAVIGDSPIPTPPCGACRQVLWEIAGNIWRVPRRSPRRLRALPPRRASATTVRPAVFLIQRQPQRHGDTENGWLRSTRFPIEGECCEPEDLRGSVANPIVDRLA